MAPPSGTRLPYTDDVQSEQNRNEDPAVASLVSDHNTITASYHKIEMTGRTEPKKRASTISSELPANSNNLLRASDSNISAQILEAQRGFQEQRHLWDFSIAARECARDTSAGIEGLSYLIGQFDEVMNKSKG